MTVWQSCLVLGGARSGKSKHAENLVLGLGLKPVYLATSQAFDTEMEQRIALHRGRRGDNWTLVEEPLDLCGALKESDNPDTVVLVDCLTLWLSNLMHCERDIAKESDALTTCLNQMSSTVVFVSNETGLGIVPENAVARRFRDAQGLINQQIAQAVDRVEFIAAGLPIIMKQ